MPIPCIMWSERVWLSRKIRQFMEVWMLCRDAACHISTECLSIDCCILRYCDWNKYLVDCCNGIILLKYQDRCGVSLHLACFSKSHPILFIEIFPLMPCRDAACHVSTRLMLFCWRVSRCGDWCWCEICYFRPIES